MIAADNESISHLTKKKDALLELKQKEYMKLVIDVPVKDFPMFFQACQEIGLTGEGVYYFFLTLDFHGQTNPLYTKKTSHVQTHRITDAEIQELIFKDVGEESDNNSTFKSRYDILCKIMNIQSVVLI